ncbi:MAG: SGNH/GDSL hydrolase family protein [Lentisphaerae bacterium]|jgi:lysophospholipase L1-like esterase|nr:SGNH/GDSL hydrolase family protein [Lentisphaerota bacterium]MBT5608460.1 SGNH/GDSL hydrolase family protein [Lentisphaerota bacterium]MBT7060290.1 SGNH/GDSL hydrolase family protein [Lentisphaerota bacterium]MBT7844011.1 SGNH/GDSL hydrolase family protein [Lentisphaerota bacterium]
MNRRNLLNVVLFGTMFLAFLPPSAIGAGDASFRKGDIWVAIGDSITHGRRYHQFIYLFNATRYPDREIKAYNCGISGDSASGAVRRFDWDIAPHKPTVATIMLGMNDVGRGNYGVDKTGEAIEKRRTGAISGHVANMRKLSEKLKAIGCRIIYITPSIYDQTGDLKAANCFGVNDALGTCGQRVGKLAPEFKAGVVDLHGPMTALNAEYQAEDKTRTIVGQDRVHPADFGQFIMAYYILKGQGVSGTVAEFAVDAQSKQVGRELNCKVTSVNVTAEGVTFACLENALPYPVLPAAAKALELIPFMAEMNREIITVTNLPEGDHVLFIDGTPVGKYTAAELSSGVNLAANAATPMYRQALNVMEADGRRHAIPARKLRTFAAQHHFTGSRAKLAYDDYEGMKKALTAKVEELRQKKHSLYGYMRGQAKAYIEYKPQERQLVADMEAAMAEVWQINKPVSHTFEVRRATEEALAALRRVIVDDFDTFSGWSTIGWTTVKPTVSAANGIVTIVAPREAGVRDMLGYSKRVAGVTDGKHVLKVRIKALKGSHIGAEMPADGKNQRVLNYVRASGEWQVLTGTPVEGPVSSVTLILAEPGGNSKWDSTSTTYQIDRVWFE